VKVAATIPQLRARLQVVLQHTDEVGDPTPLEHLHADAVEAVGADDPVTLFVECALEEARSRRRPVEASVAAWAALRGRAERSLESTDTTLMSIRSFQAQFERRSGGRNAGPERYEAEWRLRQDVLGAEDYRTRISRANYAFALRERGQGEDLDESRRLLVEEVAHRAAGYGENDLFTWKARGLLALTLISLAGRNTGNADGEVVGQEALGLATGLIDLRRSRFGRFHVLTLRAQLLRAQALLVTGRRAEAKDELRYLVAASRRGRSALDIVLVDYIEALAGSL
jgi:hypothetical protein